METKNKMPSAGSREISDPLSRSNVRKRVNNTTLKEKDNTYQVENWEAGDEKLLIEWKSYPTSLGEIVVANTSKGICFLGFGEDKRDMSLRELQEKFPENILKEAGSDFQREAVYRVDHPGENHKVHLHLKGTPFQLDVWEKIMKVPFGGLVTYGMLGKKTRNARAVGTAVGANPVCLIIGCHRVVRADGNIEGFHYGTPIKEKLLAFEAANSKSLL